jgi:pimeloyl-ACP methyl ester carboxylesterase
MSMSKRESEAVRLPLPAGGSLTGRLSYTGTAGPAALLFVHGFGSYHTGEKSQALEQACARRGWTFAAFDFRGHGQSTGTMLELCGSGLLEDLDMIQGFLAHRGITRLFPVGSSMGGWAMAWFVLSHRDVVGACAAIAPAFHFLGRRWEALPEEQRRAWRDTGRLRIRNEWLDVEVGYGIVAQREQYPQERLASRWATPLLILHGMRDDIVPWTDSLDFVQRAPFADVRLHLYKEGEHRLIAYKEEMAEAICDFFAHGGPGRSIERF